MTSLLPYKRLLGKIVIVPLGKDIILTSQCADSANVHSTIAHDSTVEGEKELLLLSK